MAQRNLELLTLASLALLVLAVPTTRASAERRVILVEDGITVEEEAEAGRALPIMIGTTTMKTSADQIAQWIVAVHTYVDWQHNCEEARVIAQPDGTTLTYNRIGSPWPVSDRDVVLRSSRKALADGGIRLEFASIDDANVDVPSGVVRMVRLVGSYELTQLPEGGTRVVYTLDSDPGGSLPAWLVKQAGRDLPFRTLKSLQEHAEAGPPPAE